MRFILCQIWFKSLRCYHRKVHDHISERWYYSKFDKCSSMIKGRRNIADKILPTRSDIALCNTCFSLMKIVASNRCCVQSAMKDQVNLEKEQISLNPKGRMKARFHQPRLHVQAYPRYLNRRLVRFPTFPCKVLKCRNFNFLLKYFRFPATEMRAQKIH